MGFFDNPGFRLKCDHAANIFDPDSIQWLPSHPHPLYQTPPNPEPTPRKAQRPKPPIPPEFDRDCKKGLTFLNSGQTYICLCHKEFCDEQTKIAWAIYVLYEVWTSSKMDCLYFQVGRTLQERGRTIHCPT